MTGKPARRDIRHVPQGGEPDPEQSARFIEAARGLGCEEGFPRFEEALKRIVKAKPRPDTPGRAKPR